MAESQTGTVAVVWGLPSTSGFTVEGTGIAWLPSELPFEFACDTEETRSASGEVINVCFYNQQQTVNIVVYPANTTKAGAATANVLPIPGTRVGIIGTVDTQLQATTPGRQYVVMQATKTPSTGGKTVFNLQLKRWAGITDYTPLS